jgi:hypothetical protein
MKQSKQENLIYLVVWGLLFASPLLSLYVRTVSDPDLLFDWTEVLGVWRLFVPFLLLFLIHNFLLAPQLVYRNKRVAYFSIMAVIIVAFTLYQCTSRPKAGEHREHRPPMEQRDRHEPPPFDKQHRPPRADHRPGMPPPIVGERDILAVVVLILMFGANLGIKGYFRNREDRKRLAELEHKNLEQQLEYLRYQINPHFFMNTLNNIHALVDIDPEQAKDTIVELSKMMRFVLYEGNKQGVPLSRELDFIRHYVTLMQLRYTEKVKIALDLPEEEPDRQIPPLILITFIENAFKHGVSYQHESFIEIKVEISHPSPPTPHLCFTCRNSKIEVPANSPEGEKSGGVGLANVRKRLDLLYDSNYTLRIHDDADVYSVELTLPLKL